MNLKLLVLKYKMEIIGSSFGMIVGWLYWYFVGCSTGTCAITSNPLNSALYGGMMGGLLFSSLKREK